MRAASQCSRLGLVDNWLRHIQDVGEKHAARLSSLEQHERRCDHLCELNVIEQVMHVCQTSVAIDAWERKQSLSVHGWIYALHDGLLKNLNMTISHSSEVSSVYENVLTKPC